MTKEFFAPEDHFCMFCGMGNTDIAWMCQDCAHVICSSCRKDIENVGGKVFCVWWNCKSNQHIRITAAEQFEKPVVVQPYEKYEGKIVDSHHVYVEINVEGEWRPIDVLGFHTSTDREAPRVAAISLEFGRRYPGRTVTYAEFTVPIDTETFKYLAEGTLVRAAYLMPDGSHAILFQGFIREGLPDLRVQAMELPIMTVHCIDGVPPEPKEDVPKEHHYLKLDGLPSPDTESIFKRRTF